MVVADLVGLTAAQAVVPAASLLATEVAVITEILKMADRVMPMDPPVLQPAVLVVLVWEAPVALILVVAVAIVVAVLVVAVNSRGVEVIDDTGIKLILKFLL